jgi:gluconate 2-dehydrogenase gamma chain
MDETVKSANAARRKFIFQASGIAGAAWMQAQWPSLVAAAQHAHQAIQSKQSAKFQVLTSEQAREVEAIAARILPTDELPGATEAGVVYFIDHALKTFASETRPVYEKGLVSVNELTAKMFPGVQRFSAATTGQQDKILTALEEAELDPKAPMRRASVMVTPDFLQTIWAHTIFGFLVDPEGGGNRDYAGWKVIGRDPAHSFSSPFGFYDQGYPGWQPAETEKK